MISLAFAKDDQKHLLKAWTVQNNIRNPVEVDFDIFGSSFVGPPLPIVDEVERIKQKIKKKKKQLDTTALNVLVIRANRLFWPSNIRKHIDCLEKLIYGRNYLATLIIVGGHVGGLDINSMLERKDHLYLIKSIDVLTKEILILANKYSKDNGMTSRFSSKIKAAFKNCTTFLF